MGLLLVPFFRRTPERSLGGVEQGSDDESDGHAEVMLSGGTASWQAPVYQEDIVLSRIVASVQFGKDH